MTAPQTPAAKALRLAGIESTHIVQIPANRFRSPGRVTVAITVDTAELDYRRTHAIEPVQDWDLVRVLATMPERLPVARADLTPAQWRRLGTAAPGVVDIDHDAGTATRTVRSPLRLRGAAIADEDWKHGMADLSGYAALCPRVVVCTGRFDDIDRLEASMFGINVVTGDNPQHLALTTDSDMMRRYSFGAPTWDANERILSIAGLELNAGRDTGHAATSRGANGFGRSATGINAFTNDTESGIDR